MANRGSDTQALAALAMAWIIAALPGGADFQRGTRSVASVPRDPAAAQPAIASRARVDVTGAPYHLSRGSQA